MIWDRTKTLAILSNFYVYMIPSVSIFGELYNLTVIDEDLQDQVLRSELHEEELLPRIGLQKTVDNVIARKSVEFFLKLVEDPKFHVTDELDYNVFISEIDYAIEQLNLYDEFLYESVSSNNKDVSPNEISENFIAALNDRQNEIIPSETEDGVAETFFSIPIDTRLSVED